MVFPQRACIGSKGLVTELHGLLGHVSASPLFSLLKDALFEKKKNLPHCGATIKLRLRGRATFNCGGGTKKPCYIQLGAEGY